MSQGLLAYRQIADALAALFEPHLQIRVEETTSGRVVHDTGRIAGRLDGTADSLSVDVPLLGPSGRRCRLVFSCDVEMPLAPPGQPIVPQASTPIAKAGGRLSGHMIARLTAFVDSRIDRPMSVADLARAAGLSEKHFARCFALATGLSPGRWLIQRRIKTAQRIMSLGDLSLCEIALACGFADQSHFTNSFTRIVGCSPGRWRRDFALSASTAIRATRMEHATAGARMVVNQTQIAGPPLPVIPH